MFGFTVFWCGCITGLILCVRPANDGRRYKVTPSLIGWVQVLNLCWIMVSRDLRNKVQWNSNRNTVQTFSLTKMHLKISSAKWRPFCPGGDELTTKLILASLLQLMLGINNTYSQHCPCHVNIMPTNVTSTYAAFNIFVYMILGHW